MCRLFCISYYMVHIFLGFMAYILVGGPYSSVYVPPSLYIFHYPCNVHSCGICLFSILLYLYAYFFVHITPSFTFCQLCEIYP